MRTLKFRVWDKVSKKWNSSRNYPLENIYGYCLEPVTGDVIQQFTGFLDKNGKEIYEGDILDARVADDCIPDLQKWKYQLIVFFSDEGSWEAKEKIDRFAGSCFPFHNDHYEILLDKTKIIGNIFENPELLK